jgi:hypothetical protein
MTNSKLSFQACLPPLFKLIPSFMQAYQVAELWLCGYAAVCSGMHVHLEAI